MPVGINFLYLKNSLLTASFANLVAVGAIAISRTRKGMLERMRSVFTSIQSWSNNFWSIKCCFKN